MMKLTATALALVLAALPAIAAQRVMQLTIASGKGVSFQLGSQQGTAMFTTESGACGLNVAFVAAPPATGMAGMSGMDGGTAGMGANTGKAASMKVQVMPARPARLDTPDGQQLVFNCGPEGKQMFLEMPEGFKYADR